MSTTGGSLTVAAGLADLSITKTDSPDPVAQGGAITYTIGVSNGGPDRRLSREGRRHAPCWHDIRQRQRAPTGPAPHVSGTVTCDLTGGNLANGRGADHHRRRHRLGHPGPRTPTARPSLRRTTTHRPTTRPRSHDREHAAHGHLVSGHTLRVSEGSTQDLQLHHQRSEHRPVRSPSSPRAVAPTGQSSDGCSTPPLGPAVSTARSPTGRAPAMVSVQVEDSDRDASNTDRRSRSRSATSLPR